MSKRNGSVLFALLVLMSAAPALSLAQQQRPRDQDEPIRLKADLVNVTAAVTDAGGRPIKLLKETDFVVYEDGARQKIAHFARTDEAFTVLTLLDISGSTRDEIALMKQAAKRFLRELRSNDRVGVIVFSGEVEQIADFTSDRASLEAAIERVATPEGNNGQRFSTKTGTAFYDALYLAEEKGLLKNVEGRKAIVCMSDGVDSTSKMSYSDIAKPVEQSDASAYFLELNTEQGVMEALLKPVTDPGYVNLSQRQVDRYYDQYEPESFDRLRPAKTISPLKLREINAGLYEISRRELREMAERTGGRVYPVSALTDLSAVYKQVADDLRSQYTLSYYPSNDVHDGRWRKITVEVRGRDAKVRARSGYWAASK